MTLVSLLQSVPCVYYRATVGNGGDRRTPDSGYTEERSIGFRVRDETGSLRVFPRGARFDAPVRFEGETGLAGGEPAGLDLRRGGSTQADRDRPGARSRGSARGPGARMLRARSAACAIGAAGGPIARRGSSPATP